MSGHPSHSETALSALRSAIDALVEADLDTQRPGRRTDTGPDP